MNSYNGFTPSQRMAAYKWLIEKYNSGERKRPNVCDACEQDKGHIEPHSENYSAPYGEHIGEYGLCYRCHMMVHNRFKNQDAWNTYRLLIREGFSFAPINKNYPIFKEWFDLYPQWTPLKTNEPKKETALDKINRYRKNS